MFVTLCMYRAKIGEEDAIIALHEDRERDQALRAKGYLSGELFRDVDDPQLFLDVERYESETSAELVTQDPEQISWFRRLVSLTELAPTPTRCYSVWQTR